MTVSRSTIDNAVTAGFRAAVGYCPLRDGARPGLLFHSGHKDEWGQKHRKVPPPSPKRRVRLDAFLGVVET